MVSKPVICYKDLYCLKKLHSTLNELRLFINHDTWFGSSTRLMRDHKWWREDG